VGRVQTGIDVLEVEKFAALRGKHVGLITNHTGMDFQERSTVNLLAHAPGVLLVALFSPEHGIAGHADEKLPKSQDASTGLPIYSLYGEHLRPTDEMLQGIDALVFDVQDAACGFTRTRRRWAIAWKKRQSAASRFTCWTGLTL
jgi:uncharacterized protein YbbC (DUF1343 family)